MKEASRIHRRAIGTTRGGKVLSYNERLYEFMLDQDVVELRAVQELDCAGYINWFYLEHRDWFKKLDCEVFTQAHLKALSESDDLYGGMTPEERVRADAARNDSILAGKIVDADPALVHAVVHAIESKGLLASNQTHEASNPLAQANLPKGMEALSQLERAYGDDRKMTFAEKQLMKRILKNDDKEKRRREKQVEKLEQKAEGESADAAMDSDNESASKTTSGQDATSTSAQPQKPAGRFGSLVENMLSKFDDSEKTVGELSRSDPIRDSGDGHAGRAEGGRMSSNMNSRQGSSSQMETVPGMKEAKGSGGILGILSLFKGNQGGGKQSGSMSQMR